MKIEMFVVILVLALMGGGYFFYQNQILQSQIVGLKDEKAGVEKELAVWQSTDLAKEAELLQLKLQAVEKDLAYEKKELAKVTKDKSDLVSQLQAIQSDSAKIKIRLDAVDALERMVGAGPNAQSVASAGAKISSIRESDISDTWTIAQRDIDLVRLSWNGNTIADTVIAITASIRNLLP